MALSPAPRRCPLPGVLPGRPSQTVQLRLGTFRIDSVRDGRTLLVAGQSLAEQDHVEAVLGAGEALAAPVLLLAVLAGALIIGLRALSPVEQSRRVSSSSPPTPHTSCGPRSA